MCKHSIIMLDKSFVLHILPAPNCISLASFAQEHEKAPEFPQPDATWVPATAPFGWEHANLGPLRDMLVAARDEGRFHPNPSLPL